MLNTYTCRRAPLRDGQSARVLPNSCILKLQRVSTSVRVGVASRNRDRHARRGMQTFIDADSKSVFVARNMSHSCLVQHRNKE
jgi:hypothetical protein